MTVKTLYHLLEQEDRCRCAVWFLLTFSLRLSNAQMIKIEYGGILCRGTFISLLPLLSPKLAE